MRKASVIVSVFTVFIAIILVTGGFAADIIKPLPVPQKTQRVTPVVPSGGTVQSVPTQLVGPKPVVCTPMQFASTSPLPTMIIGGDYSYQFQVSGGVPPYTFCSLGPNVKNMAFTPNNGCVPPQNSPGNIVLSNSGLLKGQATCSGSWSRKSTQGFCSGGVCCAGTYQWGVKVTDSCPSGVQSIVKEFWIKLEAL